MSVYILKLFVLLPVMGLLIFVTLWLYRKYQPILASQQDHRNLKLVDSLALSNFSKLAIVEFDGRKILLSVSRNRIERLTESDATE